MNFNISKLLFPSIVGVSVYIIVNKFFPETVETFERDPLKNVRGGERIELTKRIIEKILTDRALKLAIVSVFATASV